MQYDGASVYTTLSYVGKKTNQFRVAKLCLQQCGIKVWLWAQEKLSKHFSVLESPIACAKLNANIGLWKWELVSSLTILKCAYSFITYPVSRVIKYFNLLQLWMVTGRFPKSMLHNCSVTEITQGGNWWDGTASFLSCLEAQKLFCIKLKYITRFETRGDTHTILQSFVFASQ